MIHLAYLQHCRLVVGQRRLRSRLEFGCFWPPAGRRSRSGARTNVMVESIGGNEEPQLLLFIFLKAY